MPASRGLGPVLSPGASSGAARSRSRRCRAPGSRRGGVTALAPWPSHFLLSGAAAPRRRPSGSWIWLGDGGQRAGQRIGGGGMEKSTHDGGGGEQGLIPLAAPSRSRAEPEQQGHRCPRHPEPPDGAAGGLCLPPVGPCGPLALIGGVSRGGRQRRRRCPPREAGARRLCAAGLRESFRFAALFGGRVACRDALRSARPGRAPARSSLTLGTASLLRASSDTPRAASLPFFSRMI